VNARTPGEAAFAAYYGPQPDAVLDMVDAWDSQSDRTRDCWEAAAKAAAAQEPPMPNSLEAMAREFHAALRVHGGFAPESPTAAVPERLRKLRQALLDEEVEELREAVAAFDIVKIADALADIAYVISGTAVTYGIPLDAVLAEVHRSNMTKTNTPAEAKLVKGLHYEPPRIAEILAEQAGS
jgi:predicted HAD superfamily Cof-like phosphohydrolase